MNQQILSRLRIVPISSISTFEHLPEDRSSYTDPFGLDRGIVRHPFQVLPRPKSEYLLLTQVDAFHALKQSGLNHLPVQECISDEIAFESSILGMTGFGRTELDRILARHPDIIKLVDQTSIQDRSMLSLGFRFPESSKIQVTIRNPVAHGCPAGLDLLFRSIESCGGYSQVKDQEDSQPIITRGASFAGTVSVPAVSLADACAAADSDRPYPRQLSRVSTRSRVLNVDIPISVLTSDASLQEKESFLREMVAMRIQSCRTEYFQGPVYLLNW